MTVDTSTFALALYCFIKLNKKIKNKLNVYLNLSTIESYVYVIINLEIFTSFKNYPHNFHGNTCMSFFYSRFEK